VNEEQTRPIFLDTKIDELDIGSPVPRERRASMVGNPRHQAVGSTTATNVN
jgi:hypothetical protein